MREKEQIVENWLPRYTGVPLDGFGEHILLTNFGGYLGHFARLTGATITPRAVVHAVRRVLEYVQANQEALYEPRD